MSTETTPEGSEPDAAVRATTLASDLGDAISELDSYQRFAETKAAVEANEEAQEKIREFEQIREEFMLARQTGDATNEDLRKLQELNQMISAPLSVDFGEKAGGCCQD